MTASGDKSASYRLPVLVQTQADVGRLVRELESIDADLESQKVRGNAKIHVPKLGQSLKEFLQANGITTLDNEVIAKLTSGLKHLKDHAPLVHLTFAAEVDPESLQELVDWLRREVEPQIIISVGLQPALIGGVYLRTENRVHDFSLKSLLKDKRSIMASQLEALRAG